VVVVIDNIGPAVTTPTPLTTVPAGRMLVITDIDGMFECSGSAAGHGCELDDSSGPRLVWWVNTLEAHHSCSSGVTFMPGENVTMAGLVCYDFYVCRATFMGKLVPVP